MDASNLARMMLPCDSTKTTVAPVLEHLFALDYVQVKALAFRDEVNGFDDDVMSSRSMVSLFSCEIYGEKPAETRHFI
jgi:hypothetical protein